MTRCPSELELEAHLLGAPGPALEPHLAACERCRAQVAEMRRLGDEFQRDVFARTVDAVVAGGERHRTPRWLLALAPLSTAAAVAILLMAVRPPSGYVGAKGGGLGLTVFVADGGGARAAVDGEPVPARAAIRFQVAPARVCRLWIVSVDGVGRVSRLFPPGGDAAAEVATASTLPGGAVLDGRAGPERMFAICGSATLAYPELERAARTAAAGGDGAVRSVRELAGLPRDAAQATVLLEKRP